MADLQSKRDIEKKASPLRCFVSKVMSGFKCSAHDMQHVDRVASIAASIAQQLNKEATLSANSKDAEAVDVRLTYIAAMCHDLLDSKLVNSKDEAETALLSFLTTGSSTTTTPKQ